MGRSKLRRLDRSHPVIEKDIRFHDVVMNELLETTEVQGMSLGLYLQTLLDASRTPDGKLPVLSPGLPEAPSLHIMEETHVSAA
jgi:hypothetical protein